MKTKPEAWKQFNAANKANVLKLLKTNEEMVNFAKTLDESIEAHEKIAIFYHIRPDCDAFGSAFALKALIQANYADKKVIVVHTDEPDTVLEPTQKLLNIQANNKRANKRLRKQHQELLPETIEDIVKSRAEEKIANLNPGYQFYDLVADYQDTVRQFGPYDKFFQANDVLGLTVDTSTLARINGARHLLACQTVLQIDHHINSVDENWMSTKYQDETFIANTEIVLCLALLNNWKLSPLIGANLYLGLLTDSNRFYFPHTDELTLSLAQIMYGTGFDRFKLQDQLYEKDENLVDYQNAIWAHRVSVPAGQEKIITYAVLPADYYLQFGLKSGSGQVNVLANIKNSEIWFLPVFDTQTKTWKVSVRSKNVPIQPVCVKHNGGGHALAGSCDLGPDLSQLSHLLFDLKWAVKDYFGLPDEPAFTEIDLSAADTAAKRKQQL